LEDALEVVGVRQARDERAPTTTTTTSTAAPALRLQRRAAGCELIERGLPRQAAAVRVCENLLHRTRGLGVPHAERERAGEQARCVEHSLDRRDLPRRAA